MSEKSGGMRINAMQMKDMTTGRNIPHQFETRKDAAVIITNISSLVSLVNLLITYLPIIYFCSILDSENSSLLFIFWLLRHSLFF